MGLKGAGSYYQSHMQNTVLTDLLYKICESYLDDILVYGSTKEELSTNLQSVISRLEKFGMTINPDKVKIHIDEIEFFFSKRPHDQELKQLRTPATY